MSSATPPKVITEVKPHDITAAAHLAALAGVVPPTLLKQAKQVLPACSSHEVDFSARVRGILVKGADTPGSETQQPPEVDLYTPAIIHEVLARLKISPQQLGRALRSAVKASRNVGANCEALAACFDRVAAEVAAEQEPVTVKTPGKAGAVRCDGLNFELSA